MTALAQHHRAGKLSEWRGTTVGRLLEDQLLINAKGVSIKALWEASDRFCKEHARWQHALASRRPMAVMDGGTPGPEDIEQTIQAIGRYALANGVLERRGHAIRQATHTLCCEHHEETWTPPFWMAYHCVEGLKALASHYGLDWQSEDRRAA